MVIAGLGYAPYCGAPPTAVTLLSRWNLDPALLVGLAITLLAYLALPGHSERPLWRRNCFLAGWMIGSAALISPLCALSVALFSARLGQHMIIETIAAPLIALGMPLRSAGNKSSMPLVAAATFAGTLWFWHAPGPYAATFDGPAWYWLMHGTAFAAALWLWREVLAAPGTRISTCLAAMVFTTLQMGFLGALLTFSARPLYAVHALTTRAWGLSPLDDQQLGGIIMWIPAGAIFVVAIVGAVGMALRQTGTGTVALGRP